MSALPPVWSADSHVVEPPDLWSSRIDKRFAHLAPRVVQRDDTDLWLVGEGSRMAVVGIQFQAGLRYVSPEAITKKGRYEDLPELTPEKYTDALDEDGVDGAVLYPTNAGQAWRHVKGELLTAIARAYNGWVLDYAATKPGRLAPVAMINVDEPAEAVRDMEDAAKRGACAFLIPIFPLPGRRYDQAMYEPIWAAAAALRRPIVFHVLFTQGVLQKEPVINLIRHSVKETHVLASIASILMSGVFDRHPTLRLGAIEFGASWVPHFVDRLDRAYVAHRDHRVVTLSGGALPSDHFRRNVFVTFQDDRAAIELRDVIGVHNLLWANDYPHAESTYPRSRQFLAEQLGPVSEADAIRIAGGNTRETYGLG
jgi:predicted TIM-barrel fold metal-dependent hydrolase